MYETLAFRTHCGQEKAACWRVDKKEAIKHPYIVINQPKQLYWLTFDIDHSNLMIWEEAGLPCPNFIVRDRKTGQGHISYAIDPICISSAGHKAPLRFLKALRRTMTRLLGADPAYNNRVTKNPFHSQWLVSWLHDHTYSLAELHEYLPDTLDPQLYFKAEEYIDHNQRNCSLFHTLRNWTYQIVKMYKQERQYEAWASCVKQQARTLSKKIHSPEKGYLDDNKVRITARCVSSWCRTKYEGNAKLEGKLGLDKNLPLSERQALGAKHTHEIRKHQTEKRVQTAIDRLKARGERVNKSAVARESGISRQQISRNYAYLFEPNPASSILEAREEGNNTVDDSVTETCTKEAPPHTQSVHFAETQESQEKQDQSLQPMVCLEVVSPAKVIEPTFTELEAWNKLSYLFYTVPGMENDKPRFTDDEIYFLIKTIIEVADSLKHCIDIALEVTVQEQLKDTVSIRYWISFIHYYAKKSNGKYIPDIESILFELWQKPLQLGINQPFNLKERELIASVIYSEVSS